MQIIHIDTNSTRNGTIPGKSTLSANISAALSQKGRRVLQIDCDPKHDSTRLLMSGKRITTILDYIKTTGHLDYLLHRGRRPQARCRLHRQGASAPPLSCWTS